MPVLDEQVEKGYRQEAVVLSGFFDDDLSENEGRYILFGFGIDDLNLTASSYDFRNLAEGDVGAFLRIIQSPVGVFLEQHGIGHLALLAMSGWPHMTQRNKYIFDKQSISYYFDDNHL